MVLRAVRLFIRLNDVARKLRHDTADDIRQFIGESGHRFAILDLSGQFIDTLIQIHVRRYNRIHTVRVIAQSLGYGIFDRADLGSVQFAIYVDTDNRCIAEDHTGRFIHIRHACSEISQPLSHLLMIFDLLLWRNGLLDLYLSILII